MSARTKTQYWPVTKSTGQESARGMRVHLLDRQEDGRAEYVLVFAPGDEVLSGLLQFAERFQVRSAHLSAIGALSRATLGWYDSKRGAYKINRIPVQSELTSLLGNITVFRHEPTVHVHVNVALEDGSVHGGHALELFVFPTVELFVQVEPDILTKKVNAATHLPTIV